jgi:hypothetical protein
MDKAHLLRRCDREQVNRRAAAPLFWTMGAQQVGKAAIIGWRDVLAPALRNKAVDLAIWPFSGPLHTLLQPGRVVVAETYPAECYRHLGVTLAVKDTFGHSGKRSQYARRHNAPRLLAWASETGVTLDAELQKQINEGFGASRDGEDPFDAIIGLFGTLNVALKRRPPGEPYDEDVRRIEGWILGQIPDD